MLTGEHRFTAKLGRVYSFSMSPRRDENGHFRHPDVMACEAYGRQTLEWIAQSMDDPFHYRLQELWLDVFREPWNQPRDLDELLNDLAQKIGTGELRVYLEHDPNNHAFKGHGGVGQKSSAGTETHGQDQARTRAETGSASAPKSASVADSGQNSNKEKTQDAASSSAGKSESPGPETLFRRDSRGPDEIFEEGFNPHRPDADVSLQDYVKYDEPSQYVGTSKVVEGAAEPGTEGGGPGNLYEIENPGNGIDVNEALPGNIFSHEQEIAIPDGIPADKIKGCTPIDENNNPTDEFIPNPNYGKGDKR